MKFDPGCRKAFASFRKAFDPGCVISRKAFPASAARGPQAQDRIGWHRFQSRRGVLDTDSRRHFSHLLMGVVGHRFSCRPGAPACVEEACMHKLQAWGPACTASTVCLNVQEMSGTKSPLEKLAAQATSCTALSVQIAEDRAEGSFYCKFQIPCSDANFPAYYSGEEMLAR